MFSQENSSTGQNKENGTSVFCFFNTGQNQAQLKQKSGSILLTISMKTGLKTVEAFSGLFW
jgi:hypothetical protein